MMMRADALRNRELILDAACHAFASRGPDVPLEEIAAEAGVGVATLYRRFPTREDLLDAVASRQIELYERALRKALADPDPWQGFSSFVRTVTEIQAKQPGLAEMLMVPCHGPDEARSAAVFEGYLELVHRAQRNGSLRADYVPEDLPMLLMANAGVLRGTAQSAPRAWKRLVEYLLQAFSCPKARALPAAPTPSQMQRAMNNPVD
ncbi:MAG TPA: TetR/AcrR family transcriptional regulator [Micromonosporaceae bacterium]|nr:TetR/AcrR family transcriptional regulator [Micromonosporaceae bacterium]